jgi:hypothetical protein
MHVDHIVNDKIAAEDFAALKSEGLIPSDFSVQELRNLAASCNNCNRRKSSKLNRLFLTLALDEAEKKAEKIKQRVQRYEKTLSTEKLAAMISTGIAASKFTFDDVQQIIDDARAAYLSTLSFPASGTVDIGLGTSMH